MVIKHAEISEKIIGAAFEVHRNLGCGFPEYIYQRALAYELERAGLHFLREVEREIYYKDLFEPIGKRRVDFIVEDKILIEIKALSAVDALYIAQVLNYLKVFKLDVGLLINFGERSLVFNRLVL